MNQPRRTVESAGKEYKVPDAEILVGVSACLLGERVRYDGGHKHDRSLIEVLGARFRFVPVCPEVELGMGVPREPVRLVREGDRIRMLGVTSGTDHSEAMRAYAGRRVAALAALGLSGYVLKTGSPSCGRAQVPVFTAEGRPASPDCGLFAAELLRRQPLLPIEEEGRLSDLLVREDFIERVLAYKRRQDLLQH